MDMNNMAQRFAATYGGAMPITQDMPSFGAIPPQVPSQAVVPQVERPAPTPAPSAPTVPDGYDPDEWAQEQKDFNAAIQGGYMNKRGITKDGKAWRGPRAMEYYALHGQDAIFKNEKLLKEFNDITEAENRLLAGLAPIQQAQPQEQPQVSAPAFGENADPKVRQQFYETVWTTGNLPNGQKAPQEVVAAAGAALDPNSKQGQKVAQMNDKRAQAEKAQKERIRDAQDKANRGLQYTQKLLDNLDNGFLPETGLSGLTLSKLPGTDAYKFASDLKTLKNMIGFGSLQEAKAGSATGASGFGALSEKELGLLQDLLGNLDQGLDAEDLKQNLEEIKGYFYKALTPRDIPDSELETKPASTGNADNSQKRERKPLDAFRR